MSFAFEGKFQPGTFWTLESVMEEGSMKFKPEVLSLILLAGIFTITPYGIYGGSIRSGAAIVQQNPAGTKTGFSAGSAAGGPAGSDRARDCRSCSRKGQP
jgi:hypothetical protein